MGRHKGIQPMLDKESVRPASMVQSASSSYPVGSLAQDAAQAHPNPAVQGRKGGFAAVLEVFEPPSQRLIQGNDDHLQALSVGALGFCPDCVLEFFEAFPARPLLALLEVIPQEVEST